MKRTEITSWDIALARAIRTRARERAETTRAGLLGGLFAHQRSLIDDPSPQKAALCSRRAGKTHTCARYLLIEALRHPGCTVVYIGLTRLSAKRLIWRELINTCAALDIRAHVNATELVITIEGGSTVIVTGAHDEADAERLRGGKYRLVVIDECASFPSFFSTMVEEVIEPALLDVRGTLCLVGTPGAACVGMFHAATTGDPAWSVHRWTVLDNPHIPHAREYLAKKKRDKNWSEDHPVYQREWLGRWVRSSEGLVYEYDPTRNTYETLPAGEWHYVIGADLGYNDAFAVSVLAFADDAPGVWVVDEFAASGWLPNQWADKLAEMQARYSPIAMTADAGALGKPIVLEMIRRRGLPLEFAEKKEKAAAIELLNDDLRAGKFKLRRGMRLGDEMGRLQWDADSLNTPRRKEDERYPNNLCDATLYAWRKATHWTHRAEDAGPAAGSREMYEAAAEAARATRLAGVRRIIRGDDDGG